LKQIYVKQYKNPQRLISIQLNPIKLIEKHNNIRLTTEKDIEEVSVKFNEIIKATNPSLNDFFYWVVLPILPKRYISVKIYYECGF
jgi:hypothetical protein